MIKRNCNSNIKMNNIKLLITAYISLFLPIGVIFVSCFIECVILFAMQLIVIILAMSLLNFILFYNGEFIGISCYNNVNMFVPYIVCKFWNYGSITCSLLLFISLVWCVHYYFLYLSMRCSLLRFIALVWYVGLFNLCYYISRITLNTIIS